jgi:acyl carrier protein
MNIESTKDTFDRVREIMVKLFELEPEQITLQAHLVNDLDLDSIDAVDMIVEIQSKSGVTVNEEAFQNLRTIADVVELMDVMMREGQIKVEGD